MKVARNLGGVTNEVVSPLAIEAKLIMKYGPDIIRIAREAGQHHESVRYRYKKKLLEQGFSIQAVVDYEGLGLRRIAIKAKLNQVYAPLARDLFFSMNNLCYLTSFTYLLPEGLYDLHANVPSAFIDKFVKLIGRFVNVGIFDSAEFYRFEWFRNVPMRVDFYDFDQGVWDFDWSRSSEQVREEMAAAAMPMLTGAGATGSTTVDTGSVSTDESRGGSLLNFDRVDLLILKELQIDATRSTAAIIDSLKEKNGLDLSYKTIAWHSRNHVKRDMVKWYRLNWMGTGYDFAADRAKQRKHRYFMVALFVKELGGAERGAIMARLNKLPFLWCEAVGEDYYAELAFPVELVNEVFSFLNGILMDYGKRASYHIMDQSNALGYTFPYQLYNADDREWKFDEENIMARFENLVMKVGEARRSRTGPST